MLQKFLWSLLGLALIVGVQFYLAHRVSESVKGDLSGVSEQLISLRGATESLADQLNTVGRDNFDPQRQALALLRQMRQLGGMPFIVVIGDSITQRAPLPDAVCGIPIINAGISGSRTSNFIPFAEELAKFKPALVVVALGINDTSLRIKTSFKAGYSLLLDSLPKVPVVLASVTPVEYSGLEGQWLDPETLKLVDGFIRSIADSRHLGLVDLGKLAGRDFQTIDGVHLTVNAYTRWVSAILDGITRALPCGVAHQEPVASK